MSGEPSEEQMDEASRRIHGVIQDCMTEGLIGGAMLTDWYLTGQWMDDEGDIGSIFMSPESSTAPKALGLITLAKINVEEDIREWLRGEDFG